MRNRPIGGDLILSKNGVQKCVIRYVNGMSDFKINFNITFQVQSFTPNNTKIISEYYFPRHISDNLHISPQILSSTQYPYEPF
jgi:hypothetical protein